MHDPVVCGLEASHGRQLCPACRIDAARYETTVRQAIDQAGAAWDDDLGRLEALHRLITGWAADPRPPADRTAVDPVRRAKKRRLLREIAAALMEAAA